jgi:hypothetical protein
MRNNLIKKRSWRDTLFIISRFFQNAGDSLSVSKKMPVSHTKEMLNPSAFPYPEFISALNVMPRAPMNSSLNCSCISFDGKMFGLVGFPINKFIGIKGEKHGNC